MRIYKIKYWVHDERTHKPTKHTAYVAVFDVDMEQIKEQLSKGLPEYLTLGHIDLVKFIGQTIYEAQTWRRQTCD